MTNRLELNWKLDGFVDEQRYYCSETQFAAETKPVPKFVLANDVRTYVDTAVETDKTYYVAVGSVKNGVEKLSNIVRKSTILFAIDLKVILGSLVNDGSTNITTNWVKNLVFSNDFITSTAISRLDVARNSIFDFGADDFELSFEIKKASSTRYSILMGGIDYSSDSHAQFGFDSDKLYFGVSVGGFGSILIADNAITLNQYHVVKAKRTSNVFELIVDDQVVASKTLATGTTINFNRNNAGTSLFGVDWDAYVGFVGDIKSFKLKR